MTVPQKAGSTQLKRAVPVCGTHKENTSVDKTLLNRLCECYQTHMLRGCVKYLDGIFGVGKIVFAEQTAVIFCLFLNVFQKMQSVKCISGHYSSLWCDKKAISELSQISMGDIMTCKYPEKSWGFKLRDHSHLANDWHQMKYVLPGCSAFLYD